MNRVFLPQWIELYRRFLWPIGTYEIWIIAFLVIKSWIMHIGVFLIDWSALYQPIHAIKWETHNFMHRKEFFFMTTTIYVLPNGIIKLEYRWGPREVWNSRDGRGQQEYHWNEWGYGHIGTNVAIRTSRSSGALLLFGNIVYS